MSEQGEREGSRHIRRLLKSKSYRDLNNRRHKLIERQIDADDLTRAEELELEALQACVSAMIEAAYPRRTVYSEEQTARLAAIKARLEEEDACPNT